MLEVDRKAKPEEIKKGSRALSVHWLLTIGIAAYRKLALRTHPDHNKSEHASAEFQYLAKVPNDERPSLPVLSCCGLQIHETLSDPKKRDLYDRTGEVDEGGASFSDAYDYWRAIFPKISKKDIEEFQVWGPRVGFSNAFEAAAVAVLLAVARLVCSVCCIPPCPTLIPAHAQEKYVDSSMEVEDITLAFNEHKGDMRKSASRLWLVLLKRFRHRSVFRI